MGEPPHAYPPAPFATPPFLLRPSAAPPFLPRPFTAGAAAPLAARAAMGAARCALRQPPSPQIRKDLLHPQPPPPPPPPLTAGGEKEEEKKEETRPVVPVAKGPMPVRTSSCTKEEVDAILIQCGRLSRSSSGTGRAPSGETGDGHRSKRICDFDPAGPGGADEAFGCERYVVYHEAADHEHVCQWAPCFCPEHDCVFVVSRAMLLGHFAAAHQRPIVTIRYGRSWNLSLSLSRRWHVLVADEDHSVFLVFVGPLGVATAVSLLCVRPDGEAGARAASQFWCKLSVHRPAGNGKDNVVRMASAVSSSALSTGAPAPGQGMFLAVPQELLSGDTLTLRLRIDLVRPTEEAAVSEVLRV